MTDSTEAFAEVTDLEQRWRPLTPAELEQAQVLILDASQLVADELGDRIDGVSSRTLTRVVCAVVKRAMAVPGGVGVSSIQQGAGPFQDTMSYSNPMGDLYLTKSERKALGVGGQRAFEIDLLPEGAGRPDDLGWLP